MKSKAISFAAGFILASAIALLINAYFQNRSSDQHANTSLDGSEAFLHTWAALSEAERDEVLSSFRILTTEGGYPQMAKELGSFRAVTMLYDERPDERAFPILVAHAASSFTAALEAVSADSDLRYRLEPQIEALKAEVSAYLEDHPELESLMKGEANQPVETTPVRAAP